MLTKQHFTKQQVKIMRKCDERANEMGRKTHQEMIQWTTENKL